VAFRSDISVDFDVSPRIITVASPSVTLAIQDLVDTLRIIEASLLNLDNPALLKAEGKSDLGGGKFVGITATLLDAKIAFEARPGPTFVRCTVTDGNIVAVDGASLIIDEIEVTAFTQVLVEKSTSPALIISGSGVTAQDKLDIATASWVQAIEDGQSAEAILRQIYAVLTGKATGLVNGTRQTFRDHADTKDRVAADFSLDGDSRDPVTRDGS